jgi:hypothetical protein
MSRTPFSLAGFQVITIGRFWVIAEASSAALRSFLCSCAISSLKIVYKYAVLFKDFDVLDEQMPL